MIAYTIVLLIMNDQYSKAFGYIPGLPVCKVHITPIKYKHYTSINSFTKNINKEFETNRCDEYAKLLITKPRWGGSTIGPIIRYLNNFVVGILSIIVLHIMNSFKTIRKELLLNLVFNRPKGKGLLTVSNHQSIVDDPGIWGAILPFWRMRPNQLRWSICTEDVYFYREWLTNILGAGNVLPLDRSGSLEQSMLQRFNEKLKNGSWCHIFSEGKIYQNWRFINKEEPVLGTLKHGIGKLIVHSYPNVPIVLPIYHKGMNMIIPEKKLDLNIMKNKKKSSTPLSTIPRSGNKIECYIGKPIDFTSIIDIFDTNYPDKLYEWKSSFETLQLYEYITDKIKIELLKLEAEAYQR